jgi:hypothetical protein
MKRESIYDKMTNAEREVAELLKDLGIKWRYEHPIFVWDENNRPRVWAPDFYLISLGIYVEVCGSERFDYGYRKKVFHKNGYRVIFLHIYKDKRMWIYHLTNYIQIFIRERNYMLKEILSK